MVHRFGPSDNGLAPEIDTGPHVKPAAAPQRRAWGFRPIDSRQLADDTPAPRWLVSRLVVAGMPLVIGGPSKSLKTSVAIDLAVSLATATSFLGRFAVYEPARVAVLSGESGRWAIMETARRVCRERGLELGDLGDRALWQFDLPKLNDPADVDALAEGLAESGASVVLVDPLYLSLMPGERDGTASNLYAVGPLLLSVAAACIGVGVTPMLLHHSTKPSGRTGEPLELADLAFSGIAEFSRQWLLLNRREPFTPDEPHRLWLAAGGSCDQGGLWGLDVDVGQLGEDFTGRRWLPTLTPAGQALRERKDEAAREKDRRACAAMEKDEAAMLAALAAVDPKGKGAGLRKVREAARLSGERASGAATRLELQGRVKLYSTKAKVGNGARRGVQMIKLVSREGGE